MFLFTYAPPACCVLQDDANTRACCVPQGWLNIDFAREVRLEKKLGEGGFGQVCSMLHLKDAAQDAAP
jgi:hypothetical protein